MTSIIHDEEIPFLIVLLQEIASLACESNLRGNGRDEPCFGVEAVEVFEDGAKGVEFVGDEELVFVPAN